MLDGLMLIDAHLHLIDAALEAGEAFLGKLENQ